MTQPPFLSVGNTVGITAPARKINPYDVSFAENVLHSWGLKVKLAKNINSQKHSYLAGSDEERLLDFQSMVNDPEVKAIFCARGGYGTTRILDDLDFSVLENRPKWIIGFSDITAIHLKLLKEGIASVHGIMPVLFSKPESRPSLESLKRLLFTGTWELAFDAHPSNRNGDAEGEMIGGNLSLLVDALGTETDPDTDGKILFIEEIDEYSYKVDRMMHQLKRAGKLKNIKALLIGYMTDIKDTELSFAKNVEEVILNSVRDFSFPVCFRVPSGHENPNLAWVSGGHAQLKMTSASCSVASRLR